MKTGSVFAVVLAAFCSALYAVQPLTPADIAHPPAGIDHIELFMLIGQSNMKGRGKVPEEQTLDPRIVMMHLKNDKWYLAQHPLHLAGDPVTFKGSGNEGVGPGLAFAKAVAAREPHVMIGLIPCAIGGTQLDLWVKGAKLYEDALRRTRLALSETSSVPVVLKGALWLQGESDARPNLKTTYQKRLVGMINDLRSDLNAPELPFIAATIGEFDETPGPRTEDKMFINKELLALPDVCPQTACVDARDLKDNIGDRVHYSAESANTIGERMAEKYGSLKHD